MQPSRRWVLTHGLAGTALAALGLLPRRALAQGTGGGTLFGLRVPDEVANLLPAEARDVLSIAEGVLALEREADLRNLPHSVLELGRGAALPTSLDELYAAALPRLVALIDRSGVARRDGGLGERAGELLARLHAGEHQVPEALLVHTEVAVLAKHAPGPRAKQAEPVVPDPADVPIPVISEPIIQPLPPTATDTIPVTPGQAPALPLTPSRSLRLPDLAEEYRAYFATLEVQAARRETADWYLTMLRASRARYQAVSARTQVPWFFIGATHALEASFNFRGHLHNGDFPLSQRTRQVPANRPTVWLPPSDWESSAVDALRMMGFAGQQDWSLAATLYRLEAYNGFGYRRRGAATPYLWSFSQHYDRGKFVADGRWSATARSQQCGAAVMLKLLAEAGDIALG